MRQTKRKLAPCSRRMYLRRHGNSAGREGGERMVMEVWGAALPSWCYLTSPVKRWSCWSCFFNPQQFVVCVFLHFYPPCLPAALPTAHPSPCRTLRTWRSSPASWSGSSGARWVSSGWFMVLVTAAVCLSARSDSSSAGPACRAVREWRGTTAHSILFYSC